MIKQLTKLHLYGKKIENNTIDFLIYIPHSCIDRDWLPFIRSTFHKVRDDISDELLQSYMYHEADIGTMEVARSCIQSLGEIPYSIGILEMNIPRAFCDMNRPFSRATPPMVEKEKWQKIYEDATAEVSEILARSKFCFQLHSMCSFDCIFPLQFDQDVSTDQIQRFLSTGYSGKRRECTLLTSDTIGNYKSHKSYDDIMSQIFNQKNIVIEQNTAYQLLSDYPATEIMEKMPSSLLEITKGSLANTTTSDMIDTNKIVFDPKKIQFFGEILAQSIEQFLIKN